MSERMNVKASDLEMNREMIGSQVIILTASGRYVTGALVHASRLGIGFTKIHVTGHGAVHVPRTDTVTVER